MNEQNKYYAFISYNSADEKWAKWLQHQIEYYHVPTALCKEHPELPKRIRPVFWYKKDLSGTKLKQALANELGASKYLIVICSPEAAKSQWVNDEIAAFIQQGKGNKIIPFIVNGSPHSTNPKEECFPPALLSLSHDEEIRGIDVKRPEGKSHALVDIIATMFGIRFDELWNRHARRQKRIRNIGIAITTFLLLITLGIYDYTRTQIEYYADYVDRWGVAEGIIPLSDEQVSHRERSYRFEYRRIPIGQPNAYSWRLSRVAYINSVGIPQEEGDNERYPIQEFEYSKESGEIIKINFYTEKGKIAIRHNISEHNGNKAAIADFIAASEEKGAAFANISNSLSSNSNKSNIKRFAYKRNKNGHIIEKTFHSNNDDYLPNSAVPDGNGTFGIRYSLDSLGRRIRMVNLDVNGSPFDNKKGIAAKEYVYDSHGNIIQIQNIDIEKKLVINERLWAKCVREVDKDGNFSSMTFYDNKNNICFNSDGYAKETYKYDNRKNCIELSTYDTNGNLCIHNKGYSVMALSYDKKGNCIGITCWGVDGKPCADSYGIFKTTHKYDKKGNIIEEAYYNAQNEPCVDSEGIAKRILMYDDKDNCILTSYFDTEGKPSTNQEGIATIKRKWNSQGVKTEETYYDIEGKLCPDKDGIAKIIFKNDNRGNRIEVAFFNTEEKPCINREGVARITFKYDDRGNRIKIASFGIDGNPCLDKYKVAKTSLKYDTKGNLQEISSHGIDGKPCLNTLGYGKKLSTFDKLGNETEIAFYDTQEKPCMTQDGFSKAIMKYDDRGNCIETSYHDIYGKLVKNVQGFAKLIAKYDKFGNFLEISYIGTDEKPCLINNIAKAVFKYDNRNNRIEERYYDTKGNLSTDDDGVAIYILKYDRIGNLTEISNYGKDEKACADKTGYHKRVCRYNEKSQLIEICNYNVKNEPSEVPGYFKMKKVYNTNGSIRSTIYYNIQGEQISSQIYARQIYNVTSRAEQEDIPTNSIIVKWNNWKIGDGEEKFYQEYDKSEYLDKDITVLTVEGQLKAFHIKGVLTGLFTQHSFISQERAEEILPQL